MPTFIIRLSSKIFNFDDPFEFVLKFFVSFLTVFFIFNLILKVPFSIKIIFFLTFSLLSLLVLLINSFSKLREILKLLINNLKSTNKLLFVVDLFVLTGSLYYIVTTANDNNLTRLDFLIIMNVFIVWFLSGIAFNNFISNTQVYYWKFVWGYVKTHFFLFYTVVLVCFLFEIDSKNKINLILSILFYNFISLIIQSLRYFYYLPSKEKEERFLYLLPEQFQSISNSDNVLYHNGKYGMQQNFFSDELEKKVKNSLECFPGLFENISRVLDLYKFNHQASIIIRSADIFNISNNKDESLELILNLHPLNDQRRINKYLIEINKKLKYGGIYVGCFQNIRDRHKYFLQTYPFFIGQLFYFFDFIWARVFPKIPVLQGIYFAVSKGKNRAISFAGGLGRLVYCGFDFIDIFDYNLMTYVVAIKKGKPLEGITPSWGPIFAMRRVGKGGKEIRVLKFRTMHPYSEFLQSFVYKYNNLEVGGKLKDDFRITSWGKILRKYWIDELPMIINFLKGDLKLVGVRPLSFHYFNLYPEKLKQLRIKTKPGLVPPYYYDLPKSFDEIVDSELRYLERYFKDPIKTDIIYFLKSFYNIIVKGARSR
jgi:lipopolysaccharide/colanic/teichoic acid biosynthesis glycosyltransferase